MRSHEPHTYIIDTKELYILIEFCLGMLEYSSYLTMEECRINKKDELELPRSNSLLTSFSI